MTEAGDAEGYGMPVFHRPAPGQRPRLTLPEREADWLCEMYARADVILEYGAGGSTVIGAELGKRVTAVESDAGWVDQMQGWFRANPAPYRPVLHHVDIGPTTRWGMPQNHLRYGQFVKYPLEIWDTDMPQPDLVLIDGRFRVGCLLACLFRSQAPVTVLFDDYVTREEYHVVEAFADRVANRGRMARFEVTPRAIRNDELLEVIGLMQRKR